MILFCFFPMLPKQRVAVHSTGGKAAILLLHQTCLKYDKQYYYMSLYNQVFTYM